IGCVDMDHAIAANSFDVEIRKLMNPIGGEIDMVRAMKVVDHVVPVHRSENERIRPPSYVLPYDDRISPHAVVGMPAGQNIISSPCLSVHLERIPNKGITSRKPPYQ